MKECKLSEEGAKKLFIEEYEGEEISIEDATENAIDRANEQVRGGTQ